ncbi:hypothetical protein F2B00_09035 [Streptomyces parvus]|uniref:hypothetical protein n=1 Tax=Streptomyces parvus TaxID=66428 RepID=UPI00123B33A2|nr:hypothetical protein [Streptomyces parvus]KAA6202578.1 hypothetical protein F2B00_09035 [Streptomyces parvus]GGS44680.1 hypothetical protein GCM10010221_49580 [Streptomyces parvus]
MTAFPSRTTLRAAVLAAVAAGAVLVPSAAASADASPKPSAPVEATPAPERSEAAAEAPENAAPAVTPRVNVAGDRPAPAPKAAAPAVTPRGGVAAGERPAGSGDNSTALLAGSAAGAALLAGAGTFVLRRRSAAGRNG